MKEIEKMVSGKLYNANIDKSLVEKLKRAKKLCLKYNSLDIDDIFERENIIHDLFAKVGKNCYIESNFFCDYGFNIYAGDNLYINHNCVILDPGKVIIGDNVLIGPNCGIYTAAHPLEAEKRNLGLEYAKQITIGNNVWIGGNVVILPGVTIGDNVVIGAGSVVTKDIPAGTVAVGNPCKVIKEI